MASRTHKSLRISSVLYVVFCAGYHCFRPNSCKTPERDIHLFFHWLVFQEFILHRLALQPVSVLSSFSNIPTSWYTIGTFELPCVSRPCCSWNGANFLLNPTRRTKKLLLVGCILAVYLPHIHSSICIYWI